MSVTTKLNNGNTIPTVGWGTGTKWYKSDPNGELDQKTITATVNALEAGQYHIDAAEVYGNHLEVGEAFKQFFAKHPEVKREQLFITDKFNAKNLSPLKSVSETLKEFRTDYLDLYLVHSPFLKEISKDDNISLKQVWQEIEQLHNEGKIRNIGVSNFRVTDLQELLGFAKVKPVINQIEYSLVLQNQSPDIVSWSQGHDIVVAAYSPLAPVASAKGDEYKKLQDKLQELGDKYKKNAGQIALRWVVENGVVPISTSANPERIKQSYDIFDFELTKEEHNELTKLGQEAPEFRQYWKGFY